MAKANRPTPDDTLTSLTALGFTELEGSIYVYLLQNPPATGYGVAKGVGRTTANTYKALEGLERKGAVLVEEDEARRFRAVPVAELMAALGRRFSESRAAATAALEGLEKRDEDSRIYNLSSREQVVQRLLSMIADARHTVVGDLWPGVVEEVRPALEAAAARGVRVLLKIYAPAEIAGAEIVLRRRAERILEAMPGDSVSLSSDGRQHLLGRLRPEGAPYEAIYTSGPFLGLKFYYALIHELILTDLQQEVRAGTELSKLQGLLDGYAALHPLTARNRVFQDFVAGQGDPHPQENDDES